MPGGRAISKGQEKRESCSGGTGKRGDPGVTSAWTHTPGFWRPRGSVWAGSARAVTDPSTQGPEAPSQPRACPPAVGEPRTPGGLRTPGRGQRPFPGGCPSSNEPSGTQGDLGAGSSLQRCWQGAAASRAWCLPSRVTGLPASVEEFLRPHLWTLGTRRLLCTHR